MHRPGACPRPGINGGEGGELGRGIDKSVTARRRSGRNTKQTRDLLGYTHKLTECVARQSLPPPRPPPPRFISSSSPANPVGLSFHNAALT